MEKIKADKKPAIKKWKTEFISFLYFIILHQFHKFVNSIIIWVSPGKKLTAEEQSCYTDRHKQQCTYRGLYFDW